MRARNEDLRRLIVDFLMQQRPDISLSHAEVGAKLVLAANTGVALERALDRDSAGAAELTLVYTAAQEG